MRLEPYIRGSLLRLFHVLTCEEVEKLCYDFLEDRLGRVLSFRINVHMLTCWRCLKFIQSYRTTRDLGKLLPRPALDPDFKAAMTDFLLKQRNAES